MTAKTLVTTLGPGQCQVKDSELIVAVTHTEVEELVVGWVDVDMETCIFHVKGCEPCPPGEERE